MTSVYGNKVPPDGGYGWVIAFSYGLNMMVIIALFYSFGLVFKETMRDVGLSHEQGNLVLVINSSTGMLTTLLAGPLLRKFSYRKVAVAGAILSSLGLFTTAIASSFWVFIISYSIFNSIGVAAGVTASMVAVNSFFNEKRGRAIGIGVSMMGLGTILMPLLMSALLTAFGWRYTVLTLSAMNLHSLVSALLLRPVEGYLRYPPHLEEMMPLNKDTNVVLITAKKYGFQSEKNAASSNIYGASPVNVRNPDMSEYSPEALPSQDQFKFLESKKITMSNENHLHEQKRIILEVKDKLSKKKEQQKDLFRKLVDVFDLTLLIDPICLNILLGLAIAGSGERNFCLLLPLMLQDMKKLDTEEISILMTIIGITDTLFRFVAPFIGKWCKQPPRVMFFSGLVDIVFVNTTILFTTSFMSIVFVAIAIGMTKGFYLVYLHIILPSYVPIERLPFAWGLEMFLNGTFGICTGSLIGRLRETTESYYVPLLVVNFFTVFTITLWTIEFIYYKIKATRIRIY